MLKLLSPPLTTTHTHAQDLKGQPIEVGKGLVRRQGKDVCLLAYGSSVNEALAAAEMLEKDGVGAGPLGGVWHMLCFPQHGQIILHLYIL